MRGFCNVLKRKEKKAGNAMHPGVVEKEWKFESDLKFLLPVKKKRFYSLTTNQELSLKKESSISDLDPIDQVYLDNDSSSDALDLDLDLGLSATDENEEENETVSVTSEDIREPVVKAPRTAAVPSASSEDIKLHVYDPPVVKAPIGKSMPSASGDVLIELIRKQNQESPRFSFLKSLLPMVEALTDDQFMDFQINVITDLRSKRAERQNLNKDSISTS